MRKGSPEISYIVSCYDRPKLLPVILHSLRAQTYQDFEVIVTDNATDNAIAAAHKQIVNAIDDNRFTYCRTAGKIKVSDCYWSAEWAIKNKARGRWYAFPCDDTYYAPEYGQRMLMAAIKNNWGFVICGGVVVGPEASGGSGYRVWEMGIGKAIKTSFLIKADAFEGFEAKPLSSASAAADYAFSTQVAKNGTRWGIVPEVMIVHN